MLFPEMRLGGKWKVMGHHRLLSSAYSKTFLAVHGSATGRGISIGYVGRQSHGGGPFLKFMEKIVMGKFKKLW